MEKYIITQSAQTADVLTNAGYKLLSNKDGIWTFQNSKKMILSAEDKKDMVFSNKLFL